MSVSGASGGSTPKPKTISNYMPYICLSVLQKSKAKAFNAKTRILLKSMKETVHLSFDSEFPGKPVQNLENLVKVVVLEDGEYDSFKLSRKLRVF